MKLRFAIAAGCLAALALPASAQRMPPAPQIAATLNSMNIELSAGKTAAPQEEALCVLATDSLIAKGDWDMYRPLSDYWNAQLTSHVTGDADRATKMKGAQDRMKNFQSYPDEASKLMVHIAVVGRCERAMKAATGAG